MKRILPKPEELGVTVPKHVKEDLYRKGFEHSIGGGQITKREHLRASFRAGFRDGRIFLREERRRRGILEFPVKWRLVSR